jgi:U32 family peptidase
MSRPLIASAMNSIASGASNAITNHLPELLAPAGDWVCAKAAVENGADAIYFGLDRFNARMRGDNFTEADLPELMAFLHQRGVKGYLTLNTLIFPSELAAAEQYLKTALRSGVDAVIVQDVGICRLIRHLSPDWPIHASTQMTITSAAGVEFAEELGCNLVVLARECSIKEITKIQEQLSTKNLSLPLEIFVHGALCVAYSGQCLTSESLGGRSANRGECAQACRLPYDLIADGQLVELGDRQYLLSPQDLAGIELLPEIIQAGVSCLKIEGRLKAPEYVASVTRIYRQAIDRLTNATIVDPGSVMAERYELEMAFSRGLAPGWLAGIDNQKLVNGEYSSKRGVLAGSVTQVRSKEVTVKITTIVKPGDGVVFGLGTTQSQRPSIGGRIYTVTPLTKDTAVLGFNWDDVDLSLVEVGDQLWKTSDPELEKKVRQTYAGEQVRTAQPLQFEVYGSIDLPLTVMARDRQGHVAQVDSAMPLSIANNQPLTSEKLSQQLGRLGGTPFSLGGISCDLPDNGMLPVSELNRMRRTLVERLLEQRTQECRWQIDETASVENLLPIATTVSQPVALRILVRTLAQLEAAVDAHIEQIYCEFIDPRHYRSAGRIANGQAEIFAVPPRITKAGEHWTLEQLATCEPTGYLVRNYDQLEFFQGQRCIGDFSLNVANALTADYLQRRYRLERLTASYDLNISQLLDFLGTYPAQQIEVTIHQHMPMFHMEHCVFCAFLSEGTDHTNCGRPCETKQVELRDRIGTNHILQADVGCRNTLYNGKAQTGAEYVQQLMGYGVSHLRLEFVQEDAATVTKTIEYYRQLIAGEISGMQLWQNLQLYNQLGVTRGTLTKHS